MHDFEKLGSFYLGKGYDLEAKQSTNQYLLYDSKDLCTHAITVGMTGSGKTGLGIGMLEEAAMDGIPALIIDPKGDMTNLMLSFPNLAPEDFQPWLNPAEAEQKGLSMDEFANKVSTTWRDGLAKWEQDGQRIQAMRDKVSIEVYTPGSTAGKQVSMLASIDLPSQAILEDYEALSEFAGATASGLLSLVNIDADPLTSREHILLNNILINEWSKGSSLDLASFIQAIHNPGIDQFGVVPLNTFYPEQDRFALAMRFNNLLASPQFSVWMQGEALDIQKLLYDEHGKPKLSILSINHLSDQERMFFVSTFLNRVLSWVRSQSGTSSLRAILYMDEIYGYFPPVENPPSKKPLLSLLKQARAYGLGVVLSTQNPVDLDYKGLANIGTWFIGRLQTEQDKARLLDGLESASQSADTQFNRAAIDKMLSNLSSRIFLMNNVHEDGPQLFETRWVMSYLAGPLTKRHISMFKQQATGTGMQSNQVPPVGQEIQGNRDFADQAANAQPPNTSIHGMPVGQQEQEVAGMTHTEAPENAMGYDQAPSGDIAPQPQQTDNLQSTQNVVSDQMSSGVSAPSPVAQANQAKTGNRNLALAPKLPDDVAQYFAPLARQGNNVVYMPSLYALVETTYLDTKTNVNTVEKSAWNTPATGGMVSVDWSRHTNLDAQPQDLERHAVNGISFGRIPDSLHKKTSYSGWAKDLVDYLYREEVLHLFENPYTKMTSELGESERDFVSRIQLEAREFRDQAVDDLRKKYDKKIASLEEKVRKAEQKVEREKSQASQAKFSSILDFGSTILGGFLGNKKVSKTNLNKAASSVRSAGRAKQQGDDVKLAEQTLETYQGDLELMQEELEKELEALTQNYDERIQEVRRIDLRPKKSDIKVQALSVVWLPHEQSGDQYSPLYRMVRPDEER